MNGIQELIQHFLANMLGHKASSMIGAVAAVILAAYAKAIATGLVNLSSLPPQVAKYMAYGVTGLVFLTGIAYNKTNAQ